MKKVIWEYKLTLIAVILVLIAIMMPGDDVPSVGIPNIDKVIHFGMFGTVTFCYYWENYHATLKVPPFIWIFLAIAAFAGLTEIIQIFVPGRSCDYKDLIADAIGILVASGVSQSILRRLEH